VPANWNQRNTAQHVRHVQDVVVHRVVRANVRIPILDEARDDFVRRGIRKTTASFSKLSSKLMGGRIVGMRLASIVLPAPGFEPPRSCDRQPLKLVRMALHNPNCAAETLPVARDGRPT
jgi:hypothetical protein